MTGPDDGHEGVAPVRTALAGNRQQRVGQAWREVARRVDRVAGGAAQAHADHHHQQGDGQRRQALGHVVGADRQHAVHQHEGADDFRQHVGGKMPHRGRRAEHAELLSRIVGAGPQREVVQVHQYRTGESTGHLRGDIARHQPPGQLAQRGQRQGDRRVHVRAAGRGDVDADQHGQPPGQRDGDPAGTLGLGSLQQHAGDHAVAQQDHHHRAEELTQVHRHQDCSLVRAASRALIYASSRAAPAASTCRPVLVRRQRMSSACRAHSWRTR